MAVGYVVMVLTGERKSSFGESFFSWSEKPNLKYGIFTDKTQAENHILSIREDEKNRVWETYTGDVPKEQWEDFQSVLFKYYLKEVLVHGS